MTGDLLEGTTTSPHIGAVGIETNHPKFYVVGEQQIIIQADNLAEAMAMLMASYYIFNCEYPKQWKKTLIFIENFICDIHTKSSKMPSKVINFVQKLKNSMDSTI